MTEAPCQPFQPERRVRDLVIWLWLVVHPFCRLNGPSRADRLLAQLEQFLALLGGILVVGLLLLAVVSVGGRSFFNRPLSGYLDWIVQAMPIIAFLGIAMVQREGGHIRMDMLLKALSGRLRYAVEFFSTLVIFVLMLALVWGWAHFSVTGATMPLESRWHARYQSAALAS